MTGAFSFSNGDAMDSIGKHVQWIRQAHDVETSRMMQALYDIRSGAHTEALAIERELDHAQAIEWNEWYDANTHTIAAARELDINVMMRDSHNDFARGGLLDYYRGFGKYEAEPNIIALLDTLGEPDETLDDIETRAYEFYAGFRFIAAPEITAAILWISSDGFVSGTWYDDLGDAYDTWRELEREAIRQAATAEDEA